MSQGLWIAIAVAAALVLVAALVLGLVRYRHRRISLTRPDPATLDRGGRYTTSSGITFSQGAPTLDTSGLPTVGDDATIPRDAPRRTISDVHLPEPQTETQAETKAETRADAVTPEAPVAPAPEVPPAAPAEISAKIEEIAPTAGRLERLRGRLARSQNAIGRSMLGLIGGGDLDEDSWQDVEDTLLVADLGPVVTEAVVSQLRSRLASSSVRTEADARAVLRDVLIRELHPEMVRSIRALPHDDHPSVLVVVVRQGADRANHLR
ncbi:signal recognition particle receptor subunit alpha, partial [Mycobacterium tilburgii]|uniref:signal recognition particle receptor subunit alpha n=1 Tax=Mycobacterium tilburgii TaxID=44467 RepID=UPI0016427283